MSYLVLARKWRPQTFHDLTGQEHVTLTLKNAIESGRVAQRISFGDDVAFAIIGVDPFESVAIGAGYLARAGGEILV